MGWDDVPRGARCWVGFDTLAFLDGADEFFWHVIGLLYGDPTLLSSLDPQGIPTVYRSVESAYGLVSASGLPIEYPNLYGPSPNTTFTPAANGFAPLNEWLPVGGGKYWRAVEWTFDTEVAYEPFADPGVLINSGTVGDTVTVVDYTLATDKLTATLEVTGNGDHKIRLVADQIGAKARLATRLDGNQDPGNWNIYPLGGTAPNEDDLVLSILKEHNPVSDIVGVRVENDTFSWDVYGGVQVAEYRLEGADAGDSVWTDLGVSEPFALGQHDVSIASQPYDYIRLIENDSLGTKHIYETEAASGSVYPDSIPTGPTEAQLLAALEARKQARSGQPLQPPNGDTYVIFADIGFDLQREELIEDHVVDYWQSRGYAIALHDLAEWDRTVRRDSIAEYIRTHALDGARYFHLIGDATDWRQYYGPEKPDFWPSYWESQRLSLLTFKPINPLGDSLRNEIPTFYFEDNDEYPYENMAGDYPYYCSDQPYGDTDGDGDLDVIVARWATTWLSELAALVLTMQEYNDHAGTPSDEYMQYGYVGDHFDGNSKGDYAEETYLEVIEDRPAGRVRTFFESSVESHSACVQAAIDFWNEHQGPSVLPPELVTFVAWKSSELNYGNVFDAGNSSENPFFAPSLLAVHDQNPPLFIGASCHLGDFMTGENPAFPPPLCEVLMTSGRAIGVVGPSVGSWQRGNGVVARALQDRLYEAPTRSMAESFMLAVNDARLAAAEDPGAQMTIQSYSFLGDPLSQFNPGNYALVGVKEESGVTSSEDLAIGPNPFLGQTSVRFSMAQDSDVVIDVVNVAGQRVRRLAADRLPAGRHAVRWDGRNDDGVSVAGGVYWVRVSVNGESRAVRSVRIR